MSPVNLGSLYDTDGISFDTNRGDGDLDGQGPINPEQAMPGANLLEPETTLRDALSAMLASSVQLGVVVDERERVLGLVSVDQISEVLQSGLLPVRTDAPG